MLVPIPARWCQSKSMFLHFKAGCFIHQRSDCNKTWLGHDWWVMRWFPASNRNTGWWFQTFLELSIIYGIILPIDELIFFRGVAQPPTRISNPFFGIFKFKAISSMQAGMPPMDEDCLSTLGSSKCTKVLNCLPGPPVYLLQLQLMVRNLSRRCFIVVLFNQLQVIVFLIRRFIQQTFEFVW